VISGVGMAGWVEAVGGRARRSPALADFGELERESLWDEQFVKARQACRCQRPSSRALAVTLSTEHPMWLLWGLDTEGSHCF
jgi:hypothetical protein